MGGRTADHILGTGATMNRNRKKFSDKFGVAYSLAVEMAVAVIVPILIGRWLDGKTGKGPWFTIGGVILGGAAAMRSAYRALMEMQEEQDREKNQSRKDSGDKDT